MKKLFLLPILCLALFATAQTSDELVSRYSVAMGGLENFKSIKTALIKGKLKMQGMELPITLHLITGRALKMETEVMGMKVIQAYKDGKGWTINPLEGKTKPVDLEGEESEEFISDLYLADDLMDYKDRGHKLADAVSEKTDGVDCWKIKITKKDGSEESVFIDKQTLMIIKTMIPEPGMISESYHSDYKTINGLKFASSIIEKANGEVAQQIILESFEFNITLDEKIFDKPAD